MTSLKNRAPSVAIDASIHATKISVQARASLDEGIESVGIFRFRQATLYPASPGVAMACTTCLRRRADLCDAKIVNARY